MASLFLFGEIDAFHYIYRQNTAKRNLKLTF